MSNGEMLKEQREIVAKQKRVTVADLRLVMASVSEVMATSENYQKTTNEQFQNIMAAIEGLRDNFTSLEKSIKSCEHCQNKALMTMLTKNPAVIIGAWAANHKKLAWFTFILSLMVLAVFMNPDVRHMVFGDLLHLPNLAVNVLTK
jgi:hypothetical protein